MEREYILITGSSSGIGEEIAINISSTCNVILNGRDVERLNTVKTKCHEGDHIIWNYDLSDVDNIEDSLTQLLKEKNVKVTYFVHCAGFMKMYPLKIVKKEILQESFNINVISAALIAKVLTGKKQNDKTLKSAVFISSNISNFGAKAFSVYGSAKAGLDGLMRSLAMEFAPKVRINSVLPGGVRTRMTECMYQDQELIDRMASTYPLGLGTVTNISDAVLFLLSDKASWITGQQITVDGGRTANVTG
jgi:NAD(P)-dependent dehydrogenase (short-subunit alcohol dehydrogenase family)